MFSNFPISSSSGWDPERIRHIKVPKRTRSSRPKVRTGCVTCKRRHVKCDEVKPVCNRCERAGVKCDGYEAPPPPQERTPKPRKSPVRTSRALLPRLDPAPQILPSAPPTRGRTLSSDWLHPHTPSFENIQLSAFRNVQPPTTLWSTQQAGPSSWSLEIPNSAQGRDANEELYLNFFRDQVRCNLTAHCKAKFWPNVILREARRCECLRHAILAVGAIALALHSDSFPSSPSSSRASTPSTSSTPLTIHHQNALHHHLTATSLFRKRIETDLDAILPEILLGVTMLFLAYEKLQDNDEAAQNLVGSGMALLKHSLQLRRGDPQGQGLSEHGILNVNDLALVEGRLPTMSVWVIDPPDTEAFAETSLETGLGVEAQPPVYPTTPLEEVVATWNRFCLRSAAFVTKHTEDKLRDAPMDDATTYREQAELLSQLFVWRTELHKYKVEAQSLAEQYCPDSLVAAERQARLDSIQLMQLQDIVDIIFVSCCLDSTGMAFDTYLREYRDVVSGCAEVLERQQRDRQTSVGSSYSSSSSNTEAFNLEAGLSPILGFVVSTCRKYDVRMQALDLFKRLRWVREEGGWDMRGLCVGKMGLISLEQGGAVADGRIPATARYEWSGGRPDMERGKLAAEYRRLLPGNEGQPVFVKLSLDM